MTQASAIVTPRARRALLILLAVAALLVGGTVWAVGAVAARPVPPEIRVVGVPPVVSEGQEITFDVHLSFPDRWPQGTGDGDDGPTVYVVTARAVLTEGGPDAPWFGTESEAILCSGGTPEAAGQDVVLPCQATAPSSGPWVLTVHVDGAVSGWGIRTEVVSRVR